MPLLHHFVDSRNIEVAVWHIQEDESFFADRVLTNKTYRKEVQKFTHPAKRLEWLASRLLANIIFDEKVTVVKRNDKVPHAVGYPDFISISHSKEYIAIARHSREPVGVDVERILPRIERIKHKFLNEDEMEFVDKQADRIYWMTLLWSAEESIFKKFSDLRFNMKREMHLQAFDDNKLWYDVDDFGKVVVNYKNMDNGVFTWC